MKSLRYYGKIQMLGILMALMVSLPVAVGCKGGQASLNAAQFIINETPAMESLALNITNALSKLTVADQLIAQEALTAWDAAWNTADQLATAYKANPSTSALTNLETGILTLQANLPTTIAALQKSGIAGAILGDIISYLSQFATIILAVIGAIQSISSSAQLEQMRKDEKVTMASLRPYIDQKTADDLTAKTGITVDQFFGWQSAHGF